MKNIVCYFEIHADNPQTLVSFYSKVFGWNFVRDENIPVPYFRISNAGPNGGLMKRPLPKPDRDKGVNSFISSIQVEDFDDIEKSIIKEGGSISVAKFAVLRKCWQGYFKDPEGNIFGIFEVDPQAS